MSENNRIKDAISSVEPAPGAKERMYRNIMDKAAQQTKKPEKQPLRFARYALPIAACLCIAIIGLVRFALPGSDIDPDDGMVLGGNPFVEVESADAFRELSVTLDAPATAQNVSYAVIDGQIAQVQFELDGKSYIARASAQDGDFSGIVGEESCFETVDAKTSAVLSEVQTDTESFYKIGWTNGKVNYCLYGTDGADREQLLSTYETLKK